MRILLVEDTKDLAEAVQARLAQSAIACDVAFTAADARDFLAVQRYEVLVLDINLPDGLGTDLLRELRSGGLRTPVLMLTAQYSVDDKITALNLGADDYLVKPFDQRELEARLHALHRRELSLKSGELVLGGLAFNPAAKTATSQGRPLDLTRREFALLRLLIAHQGQVLSKERLLEGLYSFDDAVVGLNAIELYVARLRKKLDGAGVVIQTLRGQGYRLEIHG